MAIEIIKTGDGSDSLFNTELDETYHSRHGAIQESKHVFIQNGLETFVDKGLDTIRIFEVGFGTGLNALLTWQWANQKGQKVDYTSVELFPLSANIWQNLEYGRTLGMEREFQLLHEAPWNQTQTLSDRFELTKRSVALESIELPSRHFHLVYFDAFAPNKQPELWRPEIFSRLHGAMQQGAVLVTYCAKGQVKRDMRAAHFTVQTLPGPPGKREMTRGVV
ncbi:MAG: tRNA (5-methylaminomethyl-2-thiouridine)(34)-methyltransferase MnmD [Bacteroidota bacterium]